MCVKKKYSFMAYSYIPTFCSKVVAVSNFILFMADLVFAKMKRGSRDTRNISFLGRIN